MKKLLPLMGLLLAANSAMAGSALLFDNSDFEKGTLENWTAAGDAMTVQPTKGDQSAARKRGTSNIQGEFWIGTSENYDGKTGNPGLRRGDAPTGSLVSKAFTIEKPYITFRIGGGADYDLLGVGLRVEGQEWMGATSLDFTESMKPMSLDVRKFKGKKAQLVIADNSAAPRGFINVDDFRAADEPQGTAFIPIKRPTLADQWSTFPLYERVGYDQTLRPQFHFTSRMGWLNDPNGMVYYDGLWHMCFQHYAKGNASGAKSWGHAVSKDLVHWHQLPHILNPYPNVKWDKGNDHAIWSGSAVVDELNALGKQKGDVKTLFAIFTATHAGEDKKGAFFQVGAYSTDKGLTWTMINGGKPLIDHMEGYDPGQRDPYVLYHEPSKSYVMIMEIGGKESEVRIWRSTNLLDWEVLQDIPKKSAECIGMFAVPLDGNPKNLKWVITNAGTGYEVGDFDGKKWTGFGDKDVGGRPLRFDFGDCYYAAQVFNGAPDHRVVHVGWLRSSAAGYSPFIEAGMPFTQQMSVPAEITLRTTPEGIRIFRNPVKEIANLYSKSVKFENLTVDAANAKLATLKPELVDMSIAFVPAGDLTLSVRGLKINYDAAKKEFNFTNTARVEGEKAGMLTLPPDKQRPYKDSGIRAVAAPEVAGKVKLRVLVDRASLELFVNDGQAAASFVVVPDPKNREIALTGGGALKISTLEVNELKSMWEAKQ